MEKIGISEQLRTRIENIYEETVCSVTINNRRIGRFYTTEGVRQGCPLSQVLFNIGMIDTFEKLKNAHKAGCFISKKKKIWGISYADDIVLMPDNEIGIKEATNKLGKLTEKKGMELNTEKTKIMVCRKGGGKEQKYRFTYNNKEIEQVKEFKYLGYVLKKNNGDKSHIKEVTRKANAAISKAWSLGENLMKYKWNKRIRLFDALVESILSYGVEIWGRKEWKEVEKIQTKHIKWVLKLDRWAPDYLGRYETRRFKIGIKNGKRVLKYEEKLRKAEEGSILRECWEATTKGETDKLYIEEKRKWLEKK